MLNKIALPNWFVVTALVSTICLVLFLFYVDEGYYNFNWMKEAGAWFVFFIYCNVLFWPMVLIGFIAKYFFAFKTTK